MLITLMKSKIHRATVTEANLHYVGSITIDSDLIKAGGIYINEKVQICNVTNGTRMETYVIEGEAGSGVICINGAAAHLANPGDVVIIIAYAQMDEIDAAKHQPKVIFVNNDNKIIEKSSIEVHSEIKGC